MNLTEYSYQEDYNELIEEGSKNPTNGVVYSITLSGVRPGYQGLESNHIIHDFNEGNTLDFHNVMGFTTADLDYNLDYVVDTGYSLIFQFIGGGSLVIIGVSGYEDFTSFSMDHTILINY